MGPKGIEEDAIDLNPAMIRRARERYGNNKWTAQLGPSGGGSSGSEPSSGGRALAFEGTESAAARIHRKSAHGRGGDTGTTEGTAGRRSGLVLQILNYDFLLEKRPEVLPPIETGQILFERRYSYPDGAGGHIPFSTRLHIKAGGEVYEDSVQLYPLRRAELEVLLKRAGSLQWLFEQLYIFVPKL